MGIVPYSIEKRSLLKKSESLLGGVLTRNTRLWKKYWFNLERKDSKFTSN